MKVYAAVSANQSDLHIETECSFPNLLISYAFDKRGLFRDKMGALSLDPARYDFLLDSGAFSVWTSGGVVDIDQYIEWARGFHDDLPVVRPINLDVIPGEHGGPPPDNRTRSKAVKQSERNADKIRAAGLPVMEVYHWHEPLKVLDKLLERREEGMPVGIGGVAGPGSVNDKVEFVDTVFDRLRKRCGGWDGIPPLHGLGISPEARLGRRYPWWSIDASSWQYPQRLGNRVGAGGKSRGKDHRTRQNDVAGIYMRRILRRWERVEEDMTRMWAQRGVRHAP